MSAKNAELGAGEVRDDEPLCFFLWRGSDDVKLMKCTACHLVRYCGVKCQKDHWKKHKKECRTRAAELHEELLFKQPESSHLGDCPICSLPLPHDITKSRASIYSCCSKVVCDGCAHANWLREKEARLPASCPFCRKPLPKTDEESIMNQQKRIEANDPFALNDEGLCCFHAGDYVAAIGYWERAARLGEIQAHYQLSISYKQGRFVEMDNNKFIFHSEQAAIGGHTRARYNLAVSEGQKGNIDKARKHLIIAANLGCDLSIEMLKKMYAGGDISKDDYATALRAYQAALDVMKSPLRDAARAARTTGQSFTMFNLG